MMINRDADFSTLMILEDPLQRYEYTDRVEDDDVPLDHTAAGMIGTPDPEDQSLVFFNGA